MPFSCIAGFLERPIAGMQHRSVCPYIGKCWLYLLLLNIIDTGESKVKVDSEGNKFLLQDSSAVYLCDTIYIG